MVLYLFNVVLKMKEKILHGQIEFIHFIIKMILQSEVWCMKI